MTTQTIIWTTLPNGIKPASATNNQRELQVSVLVSPRLEPTVVSEQKAKLNLFPDFLNWTTQLQLISFQVQFGTSLTLPAVLTTTGLDAELWSVLFPATTYVRPYEFDDFSGAEIISPPTANLVDLLKEIYTITALEYGVDQLPLGRRQGRPEPETYASDRGQSVVKWDDQLFRPNRPLSREERSELLGRAVAQSNQRKAQLQEDIDNALQKFGIYVPTKQKQSPADLLLFQMFHQSSPVPNKAPVIPDFDFHDIISLLGDYPELMRKLGLIIDLKVPLPPNQAVPSEDTLRVVPTWKPQLAETKNGSPLTHYQLSLQEPKPGFLLAARPQNPELKDGYLDVQDESFSVIPLDVDGAIHKLAAAEATIIDATNSKLIDAPKTAGVPTLKSGGLSLVHRDKAPLLKMGFETWKMMNKSIVEIPFGSNNGGPQPALAAPPLYAEDLVRGYRIDVWDSAAKRWFSLCEREGEYRFVDTNGTVFRTLPITEAGIVETAATEETDLGSTTLKLPESLFRWEGWSLSAPRPDVPLAAPGEENEAEDPAVPYHLDAQVRAKPGTLPRLRFGHEYRIRVRVVDLAGNSVPFEAKSSETDHATNPIRYCRFEPVSSPVLVPRSEITDGEALEHLVIRSNFNVDAQTYATNHLVTKYPAATERHVSPPKIGQLTAETHGKFDEAFGGSDPAAMKTARAIAYRLSRKEKGSFADDAIINTEEPTSAALTLPAFPETIKVPNPTPDTEPDTYILHRNETIRVPYLPDPLARGVAFSGLPHAKIGNVALLKPREISSTQDTFSALSRGPGGLLAKRTAGGGSSANLVNLQLPLPTLFPFAGKWPDLQPFRLRLVEGSAPPVIDSTKRLLTVSLEKAEIRKVRMSCYLDKEGRELMGTWKWILDNIQNAELANASDYGVHGQHWMLTPYRELMLVHAVQQPLEAPVIQESLVAQKEGKNGDPKNILGLTVAHVNGSMQVHGRSSGKVNLMASWREPRDVPAEGKPLYFRPDPNQKPPGPGKRLLMIDDRIKSQTQLFEASLTYQQTEVSLDVQHEFNDTKFRHVSYFGKATSRFREYFLHDSLKGADFTRIGQSIAFDILNSQRPQAPRIAQVIPIFHWENSQTKTAITHVRHGNGLRVYLERPWFSSGDGEQLAVILKAEHPQTAITDADKEYFSQWAEDPIYQTNPVMIGPGINYFPGATIAQKPLPELKNGELVDVAGHEVYFNEDRDQWYSDIKLAIGAPAGTTSDMPLPAYFPFVRLALARYQPNSGKDAHLSTVVLADLAQLAPDRKIVVQKTPVGSVADGLIIKISGPCHTMSTSFQTNLTNLMLIHLEQAIEGVGGDLGFVPVKAFKPMVLQAKKEAALHTWSDFIILPSKNSSSLQYRVVVREWEFNTEKWPAQKDSIEDFSGYDSLEAIETDLRKISRVVFADIISL